MQQTNVALFEGNLGEDPELKFFPDGQPYCQLSLGNSDDYKNGNGELIRRTHWCNVMTGGTLAEACAEYLHKGSRALAQGKIEQRKWEDDSGNKKSMLRIKAFRVRFLDPAPKGGNGDEEIPPDMPEDDIPF